MSYFGFILVLLWMTVLVTSSAKTANNNENEEGDHLSLLSSVFEAEPEDETQYHKRKQEDPVIIVAAAADDDDGREHPRAIQERETPQTNAKSNTNNNMNDEEVKGIQALNMNIAADPDFLANVFPLNHHQQANKKNENENKNKNKNKNTKNEEETVSSPISTSLSHSSISNVISSLVSHDHEHTMLSVDDAHEIACQSIYTCSACLALHCTYCADTQFSSSSSSSSSVSSSAPKVSNCHNAVNAHSKYGELFESSCYTKSESKSDSIQDQKNADQFCAKIHSFNNKNHNHHLSNIILNDLATSHPFEFWFIVCAFGSLFAGSCLLWIKSLNNDTDGYLPFIVNGKLKYKRSPEIKFKKLKDIEGDRRVAGACTHQAYCQQMEQEKVSDCESCQNSTCSSSNYDADGETTNSSSLSYSYASRSRINQESQKPTPPAA